MKKSNIFHPFVLCFAILFLVACPSDIPPPKNLVEDPAQMRSAITARSESLQSVRFKEVILEYFGKGERVKIRQLILVKKPTMLRVQTRVPGSEEILSLLVSDGDQFAMHRRDTNEYFHGTATPKNIGMLLPVNLSAADLVRVLFGGAPWDRFDNFSQSAPTLSWDRKVGNYLYKVQSAENSLEMSIRPTDFAVTEVRERNKKGEIVYKYRTDDWEKTNSSVLLPSWIRFVWPNRDLDFSLTVRETQTNVDLPDILFKLEPPGGSRVIDVDSSHR